MSLKTGILVFLLLLAFSCGFCPSVVPSSSSSCSSSSSRPNIFVKNSETTAALLSSSSRIGGNDSMQLSMAAGLSRTEEALLRIEEMKKELERKQKEKRRSEAEYAEMLAAECKLRIMLLSQEDDEYSNTNNNSAEQGRVGILPFLQALYFPWWGMIQEHM